MKTLPDLRRVEIVALDTETKDNGLRAGLGPAWPWRGGHVCGISVAYRADGNVRAHYFPLRHPDTNNFDCNQVYGWLRDLIASDVRIVTQNGLYDWGWLRADADIKMQSSDRLEEIGALATLVDENRLKYGLDELCAWRGLPGKNETVLREAIVAAGFAPKTDKIKRPQEFIWQLPARYVSAYAEADAANTLALWENLNPVLDAEGTRDAYRLEVDLLPMVHEMRRRGIRIDQGAAERARDLILAKRDTALAELSDKLDARVGMGEIAGKKWLQRTFDAHGITYPKTEKGNPSFKAGKLGWMPKHPHWLPQLIAQANKHHKAGHGFLEDHILNHIINGRIYAEINPHRGEGGGGTRSLRFSYDHPPLQQIPSRDEELAPLIRGVFLPEAGEVWAKPDVSQQEFRLVVHYAVQYNIPRANEAAELYRSDPNADFHKLTQAMTGLDRTSAKNTNFAKIYGAGVKKFAEMINKPLHAAERIYAQYDQYFPFISRLSGLCQREAKQKGFTTLYDGARRHWNYWEANHGKGGGPCPLEEAKQRALDPEHPWYGHPLRRWKIHTALNALIQGSAARHTKLWMRACWREGIVPLLQMHDALDCSVTTREQAEMVARLGCEAVKLEVPVRVDLHFGRSWGDAKHEWHETAPAPESDAGTPVPLIEHNLPDSGAAVFTQLPTAASPDTRALILAALIGDDRPIVDGKVLCPFHDDHNPSCHIYEEHYHCYSCGAHGDITDWLRQVDGLSILEADALIASWQGPTTHDVVAREDNVERAMRLWGRAKPIADTLAATYLADVRGIDLTALPSNVDDILRFHPHCPFEGERYPCLVALMRHPLTDAPTGIQRIALNKDSTKIGRKMLGRRGAVKLWPSNGSLVIGEGLETVLAAATRITYRGVPLQPAWSALAEGPLRRFPVIPGVKQLTILVDNDTVGQAAAAECAERYKHAGRNVARLTLKQPDADFNDLIRGHA